MVAQVLTTKLNAPPYRAGSVPRPRLIERLDEGAQRKLTLLSAPAGFGKTTLVSEWLAARGRAAAWLSLDAADGHAPRFLAHLVGALRTLQPDLATGVLAALQVPRPPPTEWLLNQLINDLGSVPSDLILVLDDYHAVEVGTIDEAVGYLLDHLPPRLRLVITTREDPHLGLAGLRARGQLTELRAADLRFTLDEAAAFLSRETGPDLSAEDIAALEIRTEGWIAGLQLAALSMRGRDDPSGFIRDFAGDHRYVVDYLVEEVLQRQPERVRSFLLQTSILARLNASLCDAVTGGTTSQAMLDEVERSNLFLVPLDDRRSWYRYHPLFADVLRAHLAKDQAARVPTLHRLAGEWFEANGSPADAIHHALAAKDLERAARRIEAAWRSMDSTFQAAAWFEWAKALPEATVRSRPVLAVGCAWAHLNAGEMEEADRRLGDVEAWLASAEAGRAGATARPGIPSSAQAAEALAGDEAELRSLPGTVASARAYHALASGEPAVSVRQARRALELLPESDPVGRGVPLGILALAHWANGDLDEAHRILSEAMAGFRAAGNVVAALSGTFALADIRITQGRLVEADRAFQESLRSAADLGDATVPGTAELHVGLAEVRRLQGDVEAAERHLRTAEELGERAVLPGDEARLRAAMASVEAGLGNADRALELLDEAERLRVPSPMPDLRPIDAMRARVHLARGSVAPARAWADTRGLSGDDEVSFAHEFEYLVLAHLLVAEGRLAGGGRQLEEARSLLDRLLAAAIEGRRGGRAIQILVLEALVYDAAGDTAAARSALARALAAAEPEGYASVFLEGGAPMRALLRDAVRRKATAPAARRLLALADRPGDTERGARAAVVAERPAPGAHDALTDREAEVLRYLAGDLSGPEIARHLGVSLNTLRTHSKSVYSKLGVTGRRAAVRRAGELGLL